MENTNIETQNTNNNKKLSKPGRTVLVRGRDNVVIDNSWFDNLAGLETTFKSDSSETYFLTFDSSDNALTALKSLKVNHRNEVYVKFSYYRLFFTIEGLTENSDYNTVKTSHINFIKNNTDGDVLYYKLYRKDGYLGCGDLTLDTRDALVSLLDSDGLKNYDLGNGLTGVFYSYNRH